MTRKKTPDDADIEHLKPKKRQRIKVVNNGITNKIILAAHFAKKAHDGQFRKYNNQQYITHPARVAGRVALFPDVTEDEVIAAWLHDTIEDCGVVYEDLLIFGKRAADLVMELTNPSKKLPKDTLRAEKKRVDLEHAKQMTMKAKRIKLVDRYENCLDLSEAPIDFIQLYVGETYRLIDAIGHADAELNNLIFTQLKYLEHVSITRREMALKQKLVS